MRTVLAPATGFEGDPIVFQAALDVVRLFAGHIDVLHARPGPADFMANFAIGAEAGVPVGIIEKLEEQAAEQEAKARSAFDRFVRREALACGPAVPGNTTVSAAWHCEIGREEEWVPEYGRTSDLIVVGRPAKDDGASRVTLEAALFGSGRPILIPAATRISVSTVAVAWKSTREAARAVAAALPLLVKAKSVVVLVATEAGRNDAAAAARLVTTLRRYQGAVDLHQLKAEGPRAAEVLLAEANRHGAGLVVMGGYGHSRLREWVFGGVTEDVVRAASLPVLMAH